MSTIASPREPPMRRMPSSSQTPTSSSRPSLETSRSVSSSPNPNAASSGFTSGAGTPSAGGAGSSAATGAAGSARRNRAALREYYNLKKAGAGGAGTAGGSSTPVLEVTEAFDDGAADHQLQQQQQNHILFYSEVPPSEMDKPGFDAEAFVKAALQGSSLEDLLRTYTRVLGETRALDAEKKGLVYDNYSRLITATETIRKMRATMDPLNPMASTLDPAIAHIYTQAKALRDAMRDAVPPPGSAEARAAANRVRTRQLATAVLETPARLRQLVTEGRTEEAEQAWERPRRLLEAWRDRGLGGEGDVAACLADGEAALRGEPSQTGRKADGAGSGGA